ncbi:hypothetical protein ACP6JB_005592 [Aspergillus fumigatus]
MSPVEAPQFYKNTLEPIEINQTKLLDALTELRCATRRGAELVEKNSPAEPDGKAGLFMGVLGIALAFLRLDHQAASLTEEGETCSPDYRKLATERIPSHGPKTPLMPGRLSPLGSRSPLAATVMRVLAAAKLGHAVSDTDVDTLRDAVAIALKHGHVIPQADQNMGGDEFLYGRAGLLWSILNIRVLSLDEKSTEALKPAFESVPHLIKVIIEAGRQGHRDYVQAYGNTDALPLMWTWKESRYGLGACEYDDELVETAKRNYGERAKNTTVEQPQPALTGDYFLSRALALLLHARETPPYNASPESSTYVYRMPDRPYSLSEGLAGTICAWADACVVIQARLRKMDVGKHSSASIAATLKGDAHFQELENRKLGFPTLAYHRPAGLL